MNNYKHIFAGTFALFLSISFPATADEVDPGVFNWGRCSGEDSAGTLREFIGGTFPKITFDTRESSMNHCFNTYVGGHSLQDELGFYGYCETTGRTIAASMRQQGISSCNDWLQDSIAKCKQFVSEADDLCHRTLLGRYKGGYNFTHSNGEPGRDETILTIDSYRGRGRFSGHLSSTNMSNPNISNHCSAEQSMQIQVSPQTREITMQGSVLSTSCSDWNPDSFRLTEFGENLSGSSTDTQGQSGNNVVLRKQ